MSVPPVVSARALPLFPHPPPPPLEQPNMPPPETVGEYLRSARAQLAARLQRSKPASLDPNEPLVVLVMGNDAGDLDSVVSAISMAYLLTHFGFGQRPHSDFAIDPVHDPWSNALLRPPARTVVAVPLVQTVEENAKLRPENSLFLDTVLGEQDRPLLWLDQVFAMLQGDDPATTWRLGQGNHVSFALVDHNRLTAVWGGSSRPMYAIVDHHQDEGAHQDALLRVVHGPTSAQSAGSCASLVTLVYSDEMMTTLTLSNRALASIGALLLGPIMLDTNGLKPVSKGGKATKWDQVAVNLLFELAAQSTPTTEGPDRCALSDWSLLAWDLLASGGICQGRMPENKVQPVTHATSSHASLDLVARVKALKPGWEALKEAKASASCLLTPAELLRRDCKVIQVDNVNVAGEKRTLKLALASLPTSVPLLVYDRFHMFPSNHAEHTVAWKKWWGTVAEFASELQVNMVLGLCSSRVSVNQQNHQDDLPTPPLDDPDVASSKEDETKGKHIRELIVASVASSPELARQILQTLTQRLELAEQAQSTLGLQTPWSYPLPTATKDQVKHWLSGAVPDVEHQTAAFDRVAGLNTSDTAPILTGGGVAAQVYRQLNRKANRKVVLPAVLAALAP